MNLRIGRIPTWGWVIAAATISPLLLAGGLWLWGYWVFTPPDPEVTVLNHALSPDGKKEARLEYIIDNPAIGGATVWQEVRIVTVGAPDNLQPDDPTVICLISEESEKPSALVKWASLNRLEVRLVSPAQMTVLQNQFGPVRIEFTDPFSKH